VRTARAARVLLGLGLLAGTAHAGREDMLYDRVVTRVDLLNRAVARCQQRIAANEIDECDVHIAWENRMVPMGEARSLARQLASLRMQSVTVKSFIHRLDTSSLSGDTKGRAERLFGKLTNAGFSEQPATPARNSGDFRLWSSLKVAATCKGDRVEQWQLGELQSEFGNEFAVLGAHGETLQPLTSSPSPSGSSPVERVSFSYAIKGRPNQAALPSFKLVHQRACVWIWHRVEGALTCRNGVPELAVSTTGSRFPSHRTWVNDRQRPTIDQGPFSTLWECDQQHPDMVR
jgi:hypothetical protein